MQVQRVMSKHFNSAATVHVRKQSNIPQYNKIESKKTYYNEMQTKTVEQLCGNDERRHTAQN